MSARTARTTDSERAGMAVDRFRRATFRLAMAAQDVAEATAEVCALSGGVSPAAVSDLDMARRLIAGLPDVKVAFGTKKRES